MAEIVTEMPSGKFLCRRCGGHNFLQWHINRTNTGVNTTELKCNDCEEWYKIRWRQECPEQSLICNRKSLCIEDGGRRHMMAWKPGDLPEAANMHLSDGRLRTIVNRLNRDNRPRY